MRRICIFVTVGPELDYSVLGAPENPGIGGSEFAAFRLARLICEQHPNREVVLVTNRPVEQFASPDDSSVSFEQWTQWTASENDCVIVTNSQFRNADVLRSVNGAGRIIGWSHHPFDRSLRSSQLPRLDAIVSPGVFALASNRLLGFSGVHIPYFILPSTTTPPAPLEGAETVNYVFMSSGLAIKGFWDVLEVWSRVRSVVDRARLHIIGNTPAPLPLTGTSRLASIINGDVEAGRIVLHGPVGIGKTELFREMHIGIVNPRGLSESFVLTAFELMGSGIPIVSSSRHGMYESMRHFPEARAVTIAGIARKAIALGRDPKLHAQLSAKARCAVDDVHSMGPEISSRWLRVVDDEDLAATRRDLEPMWPLHRRALRLLAGVSSLVHYRLRIKRRWQQLPEVRS